jgi:hypothetical protein
VPAGKTLVIEAFTVLSNLNPTDNLLDARLEVELGGVTDSFDWILQPADEGVAHTGARVFRGSAQVTAYAGPGTIVEASALRNGPSLESTSVIFQIAGRLVDTP